MRAAYKYLAWLIAFDVLLQAASIAYATFGLGTWVEDGHALTKSSMDDARFSGAGGFAFHAINGLMVMGILGVAILVVSFFSKVPGAPKAAGILFAMIVVQIGLGMAAHAVPILGALHGMLALAVFGFSAMIGVRVMLADRRTPAA